MSGARAGRFARGARPQFLGAPVQHHERQRDGPHQDRDRGDQEPPAEPREPHDQPHQPRDRPDRQGGRPADQLEGQTKDRVEADGDERLESRAGPADHPSFARRYSVRSLRAMATRLRSASRRPEYARGPGSPRSRSAQPGAEDFGEPGSIDRSIDRSIVLTHAPETFEDAHSLRRCPLLRAGIFEACSLASKIRASGRADRSNGAGRFQKLLEGSDPGPAFSARFPDRCW